MRVHQADGQRINHCVRYGYYGKIHNIRKYEQRPVVHGQHIAYRRENPGVCAAPLTLLVHNKADSKEDRADQEGNHQVCVYACGKTVYNPVEYDDAYHCVREMIGRLGGFEVPDTSQNRADHSYYNNFKHSTI